ncbi:MAG: glycosyltransferase [Anaerolineae bacterium]
MRVLHTVVSVGRESGGLGAVALGLASELPRFGCDVDVWSLDSEQEARVAEECWQLESRLQRFPCVGPRLLGYSPSLERSAGGAAGAVYDVLHQHSIWQGYSRATSRWRAAWRRPTVLSPHGTLEAYALARSTWKKWLALICYERANLRAASCLHALTSAEAESMRRFGLRNPIAVIQNGVSSRWLESVGQGPCFRAKCPALGRRRILLFLSRVHPKKGLSLLLRAMAGIRGRLDGWCLVIAGPDEHGHTRELRSLAESLGLSQLVEFVGPVYGQDKRDALAAADLFVLPTLSEALPIAVLEALGAGVPVVTTRGVDGREIAEQGCGWWVDISVDALAQGLADALACPQSTLLDMGRKGRALVAARYLWRHAAEKIARLYGWLLGRDPRPEFVNVV